MLQKQKSLLTKCLAFLFIICCSVVMALGMTACSKEKTVTSIKVEGTKLILTWSDGSTESIETKGEAGKDGVNGKDGVDGKDGADGKDGVDGKDGADGKDAVAPEVKIGENGNWWINGVDTEVKATGAQGEKGDKTVVAIGTDGYWYIDGEPTEVKAKGEDGHTPVITINADGYWCIDGEPTEVKATGAQGEKGEKGDKTVITIGENGNWYVDGVDSGVAAKGEKGDKGADGKDAPKISSIKYSEDGTKLIFVFDNEEEVSVDVPAAPKCAHDGTNTVLVDLAKSKCEVKNISKCEKCGQLIYVNQDGHDWTDLPVAATCTRNEYVARQCKTCGMKDLDFNKPEEHEGQHEYEAYEYDVDKDGNILSDSDKEICGRITKKVEICTKCGHTEITVIKQATAHTYGAWKVKTSATYSATGEGVLVRYCTVDGIEETLKLPAILKAEGSNELNTGYSYADGKAPVLCNVRESKKVKFIYQTLNAGELVKVEFEVSIPATKNHVLNGKYIVENGTYNYSENESTWAGKLEVLGNPEDLTCKKSAEANGFFKCEACLANYPIYLVSDHPEYKDSDKVIEQQAATCTDAGYIKYECSGCCEERTKVLPALGHNYKYTVIAGTKDIKQTCIRCTDTKTISSATELTVVESKAATCTEDGYTIYTNFTTPDGEVINGEDGQPLKVKVDGDKAKGHRYEGRTDIEEGGLYDVRNSLYANAFSYMGSDEFNCDVDTKETPRTGWWKCPDCGTNVEVKLYKSHTSGDVVAIPGQEPTCEKEGLGNREACSDCGAPAETNVPMSKLPHVYVYSAKYDNAGKPTNVVITCESGCAYREVVVCTIDEQIAAPACDTVGKYKVSFTHDGEAKTAIVTTKNIAHRYNGEIMISGSKADKYYDAANEPWDNAYVLSNEKYKDLGRLGTASCGKLSENSDPNGFFKCDDCGKYIAVFVKAGHESDGTVKIPEATCAGAQTVKLHCKNCGDDWDYTVDALPHTLSFVVSEDHSKLTVACSVCKLEKEYELPAVESVHFEKDAESGKYVIKGLENENYNIEAIAVLTCGASGKYEYTLKQEVLKKLMGDELYEEHEVKFTVEYSAEHTYDEEASKKVEWEDNGVTYIGYVCDNCGKIAGISKKQ